MKAKLKENAPFPTQKLKTGLVINKTDWTVIDDPIVQNQIKNTALNKMVEIGGKGIPSTNTATKAEEPKIKRRRVLKSQPSEEKEETTPTTKVKTETNKKTIDEIDNLMKLGESKKVLKTEVRDLLIKKYNFTKEDLKAMNKSQLVDTYNIENL